MIVVLFGVIILLVVVVLRLRKTQTPWYEIVLFLGYVFSFFILIFGFLGHDSQYNFAIDPVDECYTPLGEEHIFSMLFYFVVYHVALVSLWRKGRKLPPLYLVLCLIFIFIGLVLNVALLIQVSEHDLSGLYSYNNDGNFPFIPFIFLSIIIGLMLSIKVIRLETEIAQTRSFKNKFLNQCNEFLTKEFNEHTWAFFLLLPVLIVITLILILFGQDYDSLVKVFTETATWKFSQHIPPPPLDHRGHYLCTVSAKGTPKIVKPICIGTRGGQSIIVNRQLQIANAFEELISDLSPKLHQFIRRNYDKYGYNLSLKVNSEKASNITYILMKPLEWVFLICLYLCAVNPENKIKKQYQKQA